MKTQTKQQETGKQENQTSTQKEIKTDLPMSEKDEVKNAERRTRKALKDHL